MSAGDARRARRGACPDLSHAARDLRYRTLTRQIGVLAGAVFLLAPSAASAATAKSCGNSGPHGITRVMATGVGCATAVKVARGYNVSQVDKRMLKGWRCKGRRMSAAQERVTCRKGSRKVRFRSTYQIELPAAAAPPSANAGS